MIIVKLMGGLGNQMFQYAAGRSLAYRNNTELKLDISFLESIQTGSTRRAYELQFLNITGDVASPSEILRLTGMPPNRFKRYLLPLTKALGFSRDAGHIHEEAHFHFDPAFLHLPDNTYLTGYWQSEKYFNDIKEMIRREFTVRLPLGGGDRSVADRIQAVNSVSLHIRRGDFIEDEGTRRIHETCGIEYYDKCIETIRRLVNTPHLFVFSDDPAWAKKNLVPAVSMEIIEHNLPDRGYEDMRLMTMCKHHIIANSTFSWWGAWLGNNEDKIVLAPRQWFNTSMTDTSDLIPETWRRL